MASNNDDHRIADFPSPVREALDALSAARTYEEVRVANRQYSDAVREIIQQTTD